MSLFKREPRAVYRVYGEDEYFGHEQPAEGSGFEVMPPVEEIGAAAAEALPYSGPGPSRRPLAVGLLATTVVGVLALVATVTLGGASSRVQRTAAATTASDAVEAHGGGATSSGEKSGTERATERASHARAPMRARVTNETTTTSRVGRSRTVPSHVRKGWASAGRGAASVSFAGSRSAATAPGAAAGAELGGEAYAPATPASQATAEFGFER